MNERREPEWRPPSRKELIALAPRPTPNEAFLGVVIGVPFADNPRTITDPIRQAIERAGGRVIFMRSARSPLKIIYLRSRKREAERR